MFPIMPFTKIVQMAETAEHKYHQNCLVKIENLPLNWITVLSQTLNNLTPKNTKKKVHLKMSSAVVVCCK